jgi:(R,R)-butanediol dehydrogenase/meso-butanediol dehydrogenase/diacetyl reductase
VIALDIDQSRLDTARTLGATQTHLIAPDASAADVRDLLPSGAQIVFETAGVVGSAERAFALAARGGRVVLVGLTKVPQPLTLADLVLREVDVVTTVAHVCGTDIPEAVALLDRVNLASTLPVSVITLDDVVANGLEPLSRGVAAGKILVDPRG